MHSGFTWVPAVVIGLGLLAALALLPVFKPLPDLNQRLKSTALQGNTTRLGGSLGPLFDDRDGDSGIYPLPGAHDAFAARIGMVQAAERSLDIQYYIWRADLTGTMLFREVLAAAKRGVRIRLLLDDSSTVNLDPLLMALDAESGIEIRVFNPYRFRRFRVLSYLTDFRRVNRRMHNKSLTVDNQATIIGGRNIADEYFAASEGIVFQDLDVLAIGPVVSEMSEDFDKYWASDSAYPLRDLVDSGLRGGEPEELLRKAVEEISGDSQSVEEYQAALENSKLLYSIDQQQLEFIWAPTRLISDDPLKGLDRQADGTLLSDKLNQIIGTPQLDLYIVSPYFVPGREGVEFFSELTEQGIRVFILTNSFEATDVGLVHSGYIERRKALLEAGVNFYEAKSAMNPSTQDASSSSLNVTGSGGIGSSAAGSSSVSSLHAKAFAVDRQRLFVGSFNFDPRSANLNTELGFIMDSPLLASQLADSFDEQVQQQSYRLELVAGKVNWIETDNEIEIRHIVEPGTNFLQRTVLRLLGWLPIEWLL